MRPTTHVPRGTSYVPIAQRVAPAPGAAHHRKRWASAGARWLRPLIVAVSILAALAVLLGVGGLL